MSAMNDTTGSSNSMSLLSKAAFTVLSTITAYILIPVAFHYALGYLTAMLVLAIVVVWALALTRMWGEVVSLTAQAMAKIPVPAVTDLTAVLPALDTVVGAAV